VISADWFEINFGFLDLVVDTTECALPPNVEEDVLVGTCSSCFRLTTVDVSNDAFVVSVLFGHVEFPTHFVMGEIENDAFET
jgi:hypothetical protein